MVLANVSIVIFIVIKMKSQEQRVLETLQQANGEWVSGQHFLHSMFLSQYHARIHALQNKRDKYIYDGKIEPSPFRDEHGFCSYRITND